MTKASVRRVESYNLIPSALEEMSREHPNAHGMDHQITRDGAWYIISCAFAVPDPPAREFIQPKVKNK